MATKTSPQADFVKLSDTACRFIVTVPEERFKRKLDGVYNDLSRNINIPGFRPGKAPRNIINKHAGGREKIIAEATEEAIKDTIWPLIKEKELTVVGQPRIDHIDWTDGTDFRYVAVFEVIPQIPEVDYETIGVKLPERKLDDEMVETEIRRISVRLGESTEIKDRPVQNGDFLLISFQGEVPDVLVDTIEGEQPWSINQDMIEVEMGSGKAIAGLEDHLMGMQLEEIKEFDIALPDDFDVRKVRGKTLKAKVRIIKISTVQPAELTDEIVAEKFKEQGVESLGDLKEKIRLELENNFQQMDENSRSEQIEEYLIENSEFPLPQGLVRSKFLDILDRSLSAIKDRGKEIDDFMKPDNVVGQGIRKRAMHQATRLGKLDLILREVARRESIKTSPEEVANYIMMMSMRQGLSEKDMRSLLQDARFMENTRDELLKRKVTHFLINKVEPERISEEDFQEMIQDIRDRLENIEKEFVDTSDDPLAEFETDVLMDEAKSAKESLMESPGEDDSAEEAVPDSPDSDDTEDSDASEETHEP